MFQEMPSLLKKVKETIIAPYDRQFESKSVGKRTMTIFAGPLLTLFLRFSSSLRLDFFKVFRRMNQLFLKFKRQSCR